jgi:hypothetical protein
MATGLHLVSLAAQGAQPKQQIAMMNYFLDHHSHPHTLILGLDISWCLDSLLEPQPFPYWLYGRSTLGYLRGLFRATNFKYLSDRIAVLLGLVQPSSPDGGDVAHTRDGFFHRLGRDAPAVVHAKLQINRETEASYNRSGQFAAAPLLKSFFARLPATTRIFLVWPPVFINALPIPHTHAEELMKSCHRTYEAIAQERHRTAVVDWVVDRPEVHDEQNFFDALHWRRGLGRLVETDIIETILATQK